MTITRRTAQLLVRWGDALALAVLIVVQLVRFSQILRPGRLGDESIYLHAFERAASGLSPYEGKFFYLPIFAQLGGWLLRYLGEPGIVVLMRSANLVSVAAIWWFSLRLSGLGYIARLILSVLLVAFAPVVHYVYVWGNISSPVVALALLGLWLMRRSVLASGLVLFVSILVKPIAPAALAILATCRYRANDKVLFERSWLEVHVAQLALVAVTVPVGAAAILLPPHLREFLSLQRGQFETISNASLHRLLYSFGIEVMPFALALLVLVSAVVCGRLRVWRWTPLYCLCVAFALLSLPVVWTHTLLLTLPLQIVALRFAWPRWRERASAPNAASRNLEWVLVVGSVLALQLSQGLTGYWLAPLPVQGLVLLWPVLAPVGLAVYVARLSSGAWLDSSPLQPKA